MAAFTPNRGQGDLNPVRVIFHNTFNKSLEGWSGLIDTSENYYPSLHASAMNGEHAMVIDTVGGIVDVDAIASKRFYAYNGKYRLSVRFAWNADQPSYLRYLRFVMDWQRGNESTGTRKWVDLRYTHWNETTGAVLARWDISPGNASVFNEITEMSGYELGYNQKFKYDYHELIWEWVCDDSINDFRYIRAILDGVEYDLSSLPLTTDQTGVAEFDNGANLLFYCTNRSDNSAADPYLLIDEVLLEVEPNL